MRCAASAANAEKGTTIMSNVNGINGSSGNYPVGGTSGAAFMSSDALLEYAQMQLGGLDGEVDNQMKSQEMQLREREAVESAEQVINGFGTDGPQNAQDMAKCVTALDDAIKSLPPGDPVAAQLQQFESNITSKYGYTPPQGQPLSPSEQAELQVLTISGSFTNAVIGSNPYQTQINALTARNGSLANPPNKDRKEWQGDMDALSNIADDVKSNAELQMLQLQDLVSQRQQAVQLVSGMMSKTDQTLEDLAKAIGQ